MSGINVSLPHSHDSQQGEKSTASRQGQTPWAIAWSAARDMEASLTRLLAYIRGFHVFHGGLSDVCAVTMPYRPTN